MEIKKGIKTLINNKVTVYVTNRNKMNSEYDSEDQVVIMEEQICPILKGAYDPEDCHYDIFCLNSWKYIHQIS